MTIHEIQSTELNLSQIDFTQHKPPASTLLSTLIQLEKDAKKSKTTYSFEELLGTWQLTFITGTKKAQKQAGVALGKGRYLPKWLNISIQYRPDDRRTCPPDWRGGTVINRVQFGFLRLEVSGAIKYQAQKRLLGFDFTHVNAHMGGLKLYNGEMRGGSQAIATFDATPIAKQAFFSYFYVTPAVIAARGRGGGIALWKKISP